MRQYLILLFVLPVTELSASEQIPCQVRTENNVQYLKIIWYKVITSSDSLVGLVMKDIRKNSTILYKPANLSYQIGDDFSLLIPQDSVAEVCETYRCSLWPHVGHRILKSDYSRPQGCQNADVYSAVQTMEAPLNNFVKSTILIFVAAVFLILLSGFAFVKKFILREKYTEVPV